MLAPRPYRSIVPYFSILFLTFGIMLLIFGGMIGEAGPRHWNGSVGPVLSAVTIPLGIGLIVLGGMLRKHAKRVDANRQSELTMARGLSTLQGRVRACDRCKSISPAGAAYCRNCGQHLR